MASLTFTRESFGTLELLCSRGIYSLYRMDDTTLVKTFKTNLLELNLLKMRIEYYLEHQHEYLLNIEDKVFIDDDDNTIFKGYSFHTYGNGTNLRNYFSRLPFDEKIQLSKKLSMNLKRAHNDGVIVGDVSFDNILTDGTSTKFACVENMGINGSLPPLMFPYYLDKNTYIPSHMKGTIESDIFLMHKLIFDLFLRGYLNYDIFMLDINNYIKAIRSLDLPNDVYQAFINLYNIFNDNKLIMYPHEYLDNMSNYVRSRRRF